jgi:hypothetical protein
MNDAVIVGIALLLLDRVFAWAKQLKQDSNLSIAELVKERHHQVMAGLLDLKNDLGDSVNKVGAAVRDLEKVVTKCVNKMRSDGE